MCMVSQDEQGHDVVLMAARSGRSRLTKYLIDEKKLSAETADLDGATVLHWAIISSRCKQIMSGATIVHALCTTTC